MLGQSLQPQKLQLFWDGVPQGLELFLGIFDYASRGPFVKSDTDVGREGLRHRLHCNSSHRCSVRLRSGLCQSSSPTPNLLIHFTSLQHRLVDRCPAMLELEGAIPKLFAQSWDHSTCLGFLHLWS